MYVALLHGWVGGPAGGGGGSRHMLDVARVLDELGHRVTVASYDRDAAGAPELTNGLDIRSVRSGSFEARSGKRDALRRMLREMPRLAALVPRDVDVIHAHEWPALHAASLAGARLQVPFVWSRNDHTIWERVIVPGVRDDVRRSTAGRVVRAAGSFPDFVAARRAAAVLCLDEPSRQMAQRAFRRRADIIPAPPAEHFFSPPQRSASRRLLGIADDTFLVLGVGIMSPQRRFEDLVDAIALVDGAHALIVGSDHVDPAYGRFVAERIDSARLRDRVSLALRTFGEDELRAAYAAADVFVFPNDHRQTWGLAPLEALASGTPVVVSRAAGIASAIAGRAGVTVVDAHAPGQIAAALAGAIRTGPQDLEATRAWVHEELGGRRYGERIVAVYEQAIANGARR